MIALWWVMGCHSPGAVTADPAAEARPEPSRDVEPSEHGGDRCEPVTTSTLAGVRIVGPTLPCTLRLADLDQETAAWTVVVDHDVSGLLLASVDAGGCVRPGPSGLLVALDVTSEDHPEIAWAERDFGLCADRAPRPGQAMAGTWPDSARWQPRIYGGPSDTSNLPGEAFPPGHYALRVRASGTSKGDPWEVASVTRFELVP